MKNQAAVSLGRLGGKSTSEAKRRAVRENGKLGGRPKKPKRAARLPNADLRQDAGSAASNAK